MFFLSESEIYAEDITFKENKATSGAGMHIRKQSKATLKYLNIQSNEA